MHILMVIPPYVLGANNQAITPNKAMLPTGPLGIAAMMRDRGHDVEILDLVFTENWQQGLPDQIPDILMISCHTIRNISVCKAVLDCLERLWRKLPYTVIGGNACLEMNRGAFLKLGLKIDLMVQGFAHYCQLLRSIEARKKQGKIKPYRLEELPLPACELLPAEVLDQYRYVSNGRYPLYGFATGCHWSCNYCTAKMNMQFISRDFRQAIQEVELAQRLGYRDIWCVDNLILNDPDIAAAFDQEVTKRQMHWTGMTRGELVCKLPDNFLGDLRSLCEIAVGVEGASAAALANLNRAPLIGYTVESYLKRVAKAFEQINRAGITSNAFAILDLPLTEDGDFADLQRLFCFIEPTTVSWSFYNPPIQSVLEGLVAPADMGFYRWPLGFSKLSRERVVQQAMLLSGQYWCGWQPDQDDLYWETEHEFGVNFLEQRLLQEKTARSPIGDIWEVWQTERRYSHEKAQAV